MSKNRSLTVLPARNSLIPRKSVAFIGGPKIERLKGVPKKTIYEWMDEPIGSGILKGVSRKSVLMSAGIALGGLIHYLSCDEKDHRNCKISMEIMETDDPRIAKAWHDRFWNDFFGDPEDPLGRMMRDVLAGTDDRRTPSRRP